MTLIRTPAVAGRFYPANAGELSATVATLLNEAQGREAPAPKALIVPHAGYTYSGPVAATAYARLQPYRNQYQRVVLIGPCHRGPVHGLALSSADAFRTPLGDVPLDKPALASLDAPEFLVISKQCSHQQRGHKQPGVMNGWVFIFVMVGRMGQIPGELPV